MTRFISTAKGSSCSIAVTLLLAAAPALANEGHDLTFAGDGTFFGPHGGQAIQVAVFDVVAGEVVATEEGQVGSNEPPAFSFTFPGVLEEGKLYDVHYWIDSNFGGGSEGSCDPVNVDHQWRVALTDITEPVSLEVAHDPSVQAPVCTSFEE
ncbi:hypothetical protein [Halomonas daqiaonensis]|uniref:Uncharacterized protein n=1 Tax=Halomonas daqiaonensis TaxID=650850 RepID=A0A1H7SGS0_9GAMM|nr:hypothetical protein [Halomonas daqiaonensis]SEL71386.1 hypothetical protein SAMN04488129_11491 [Halomonas daqiaonensis]